MLAIHTLEVLDGSSMQQNDCILFGNFPDVATVAGSGAGAAVTKAFAFSKPIKASYTVQVTANQDAVPYVTSKTTTGFTVTLNPRLAANTLAAGTVDIVVKG
jgi:hypothetical protein